MQDVFAFEHPVPATSPKGSETTESSPLSRATSRSSMTYSSRDSQDGSPFQPARLYETRGDAMDSVEFGMKAMEIGSSTPPINMTPSQTPRATSVCGRLAQEEARFEPMTADHTPRTNPLSAKAMKRKKRAAKKAAAAPAMNTVRGFTPAASGDDDSDYSVASSKLSPRPKHRLISGLSPAMAPTSSSGGISALKTHLDKLNLGSPQRTSNLGTQTPSNASVTSEALSEVSSGETTSYEVPLEHEFVSPDLVEKTATNDSRYSNDTPHRKMTAEDFEPLKCLGKGTYGTVLLVKHRVTGRLYAQKHFQKASLVVRKKLVEQTKTERAILESVNRHAFVVKLYYAFQDREKLYLILEYAQGGELFHHLALEKMFTEEVASFYLAELVLALEHLHLTVGVIYRDLKPENCLLDSEGHLLLTDFGLSKVAADDEDRCNSSLGTIEYMAPEVIQGKPYGRCCDWWSLGALGFDLLTGSPPFQANNHAKIQEKILKQKLVLPYFLSPDAKDLLTRLLRKEPSKRLGTQPKDLHTIKKHRFFRKIDWKALERREVEPPIQPFITDPELAENFSEEFTALALSPVIGRSGGWGEIGGAGNGGREMNLDQGERRLSNGFLGPGHQGENFAEDDGGLGFEKGHKRGESDLFGGFSFVASSSLLEDDWGSIST